MKYMLAIGQHQRLSLANGLLQMFSQADKLRNVSRGMQVLKKNNKKNGYSNLKTENRMPTHQTNIRIIEYSGPALVLTTFLGLGTFQLHCCLCRVRKLSDFIKNILISIPKMNRGLIGLERHEGE